MSFQWVFVGTLDARVSGPDPNLPVLVGVYTHPLSLGILSRVTGRGERPLTAALCSNWFTYPAGSFRLIRYHLEPGPSGHATSLDTRVPSTLGVRPSKELWAEG